jgi:outer membrane protein OmpA-like peptidoglycan-associated protein
LKIKNVKTMNRLNLVSATFALALVCSTAQAQVGRRLQDAAGRAAERAATQQTEKRVEGAVNNAIDGALDGNKDNNQQQQNAPATPPPQQQQVPAPASPVSPTSPTSPAQTPQQGGNALEMEYAKNDFLPGDEIFFEDLMDNEQTGEFPSMWDLVSGTGEIVSINGKKAIIRDRTGLNLDIAPLMKDMKNYLPEKFTLEMDLWFPMKGGEGASFYKMYFLDANGRPAMELVLSTLYDVSSMEWNYTSTSGANVTGKGTFARDFDGWYHLSISFNQRAFKGYMNGVRIANIPNMQQPVRFTYSDFGMNGAAKQALTNVRFAQGAVPLYDRMLSDGKFITYGITFDVGKSTIKPESMGEINRIATLLKENPDLKFSVEGHTDSTGNAANNQTLSEARSQAVVDKLVENGIARDRLKAAGKGQTSPIADNGTDEGRAKNRRVEFVKI